MVGRQWMEQGLPARARHPEFHYIAHFIWLHLPAASYMLVWLWGHTFQSSLHTNVSGPFHSSKLSLPSHHVTTGQALAIQDTSVLDSELCIQDGPMGQRMLNHCVLCSCGTILPGCHTGCLWHLSYLIHADGTSSLGSSLPTSCASIWLPWVFLSPPMESIPFKLGQLLWQLILGSHLGHQLLVFVSLSNLYTPPV